MSGLLVLLGGTVVLLAGGGMAFRLSLAQRAEQRRLDNRLGSLQTLEPSTETLPDASSEIAQRLPRSLQVSLARADLTLRVDTIVLLAAIIAIGGLILSMLIGWIVALLGIAGVLAGGFIGLKMLAARRIGRFTDELPSFLDSVRQMLITGNSIQQAIVKTTENAHENAQRYLRPMIRRMQNGASVAESTVWLAERLNMLELHMFATAIQTNVRYGGRLSNVLLNLVAVLRDRARVIRELKAATAETRMSSIILGCLPIAAAAFIAFTNPAYIAFFTETTAGHHLLYLAIALQCVGILMMRWLMRLDY